ncbi:hypothetical protein AALB16_07660 [Lachnospiraceae bacterium 62-35]
MTIKMLNGFPIYAVTRKEVEYRPSYFQQQAETWVEGSKRDKLSEQEIEALKKKYNSSSLSKEDTVALFGELVEAGIMSISTARDIYCRAIPLDVSKINPTKPEGVLTRCDDSRKTNHVFGSIGGLGTMLGVGGLESYKSWYEYAKSATDVDVKKSSYFQEYRQFLNVLEQMNG